MSICSPSAPLDRFRVSGTYIQAFYTSEHNVLRSHVTWSRAMLEVGGERRKGARANGWKWLTGARTRTGHRKARTEQLRELAYSVLAPRKWRLSFSKRCQENKVNWPTAILGTDKF